MLFLLFQTKEFLKKKCIVIAQLTVCTNDMVSHWLESMVVNVQPEFNECHHVVGWQVGDMALFYWLGMDQGGGDKWKDWRPPRVPPQKTDYGVLRMHLRFQTITLSG